MVRIDALIFSLAAALAFLFQGVLAKDEWSRPSFEVQKADNGRGAFEVQVADEEWGRELSANATTAAPTKQPEVTNGVHPTAALAHGVPMMAVAAVVVCQGWLVF